MFIREWKAKSSIATIVCIHGMMASSEYFSYFGRIASKRGITVIAPDLAGYGKSEGERGAYVPAKKHLDDISKVAPDNAFLLGHSLGAVRAVEYASLHHIGGLVLASPGFMLKAHLRTVMGVPGILSSVVSGKKFDTLPMWPDSKKHCTEGRMVMSRKDLPKSFDISYLASIFMETAHAFSLLPSIKIPSLFLMADDDNVVEPASILLGFGLCGGKKRLIRTKGKHVLSYLFSLSDFPNATRKKLALSIVSWVKEQALSGSQATA